MTSITAPTCLKFVTMKFLVNSFMITLATYKRRCHQICYNHSSKCLYTGVGSTYVLSGVVEIHTCVKSYAFKLYKLFIHKIIVPYDYLSITK